MKEQVMDINVSELHPGIRSSVSVAGETNRGGL